MRIKSVFHSKGQGQIRSNFNFFLFMSFVFGRPITTGGEITDFRPRHTETHAAARFHDEADKILSVAALALRCDHHPRRHLGDRQQWLRSVKKTH